MPAEAIYKILRIKYWGGSIFCFDDQIRADVSKNLKRGCMKTSRLFCQMALQVFPFVCIGLVALVVTGLTGCKPMPVEDGKLGVHKVHGHEVISTDDSLHVLTERGPRQPHVIQTDQGQEEVWVAPTHQGKWGGTLRTASIGSGPKTFNPWAAKDGTSSAMGGMLVSGLVKSDPVTGEVIPDLASRVDVLPDKKTYRVTLRRGLRWSDGKPMTADDVIFTWNTIIKNGYGNASLRDNTLVAGQFPLVQKIDRFTLQFKTAKPFVPFMRRLGYPIAPKHVFASIIQAGGDAAFQASWTVEQAIQNPESLVSLGMWTLAQYDPSNQQVMFKKNPYYGVVDLNEQRLPYLDQYQVRFVNDMNAMALRFEQGELDTYTVPGQYVTHVRYLKSPPFTLYNLGASAARQFLFFNLNPRHNPETGKPLVDPIHSQWFRDPEFRKAVDWAIHREDMVANILKGVGEPAYTAESSASPFLEPTLKEGHPRDVEKARLILKKAGYTWDAEGQLLDSQANVVRFELLTNSGNDQRENMGVMLKEDLSDLGIHVDFKPIEFNILIGRYDSGTWEASIMGLGGGSPLEPHDGANVWKSDGALHMFNQRRPNKKGVVDISDREPWEIELDNLFEEGAQTFELEKRKAIYHRYQHVVAEQNPFIYLISGLNIVAVHQRVHGELPTALGGIFHNMDEIWVEKR